MPMTDGNPTIDPAVISQAVSQGVAQGVQQIQKMNLAEQKQETRFEKKVKSLLSTENVDKDNLNTIAELIDARAQDAEEKVGSTAGSVDPKQTRSRYLEAIQDSLEKYIEGDEQLESVADDLAARVEKSLANDSAVVSNFNVGHLDKRQIRNKAKEVVELFEKNVLKRDQSAKGITMDTKVSGTAAGAAIENSGTAGSIDDITEPHRRESFRKLNSLFKRSGMKPEVAQSKAFEAATRDFKKQGSAA